MTRFAKCTWEYLPVKSSYIQEIKHIVKTVLHEKSRIYAYFSSLFMVTRNIPFKEVNLFSSNYY